MSIPPAPYSIALVPEALTALTYGALLAAVVALVVAWRAHRRAGRLEEHYQLLMQGADGKDMAAALEMMGRRLGGAEAGIQHLDGQAETLDVRLRSALRHVKVLRFNAFADAGGDQSFAIALLDDEANGVVLSGLHGRSGVRVYAKPVFGGRSPYAMSSEEEKAVVEADPRPANG